MKIFLVILTIFQFLRTFGQTSSSDNCYANTNARTKATQKTYPFNKADRILLVEYKAVAVYGNSHVFSWDTVQIIPKRGKDIDTAKFIKKHQLTRSGVDSLLKIINQRSKDNIVMEGMFVEPSNGILFFDKEGNVFEYIIICFSQIDLLRNYTEWSGSNSQVNLGWWCKDKGRLLSDFFLSRGVDIVVTKWE